MSAKVHKLALLEFLTKAPEAVSLPAIKEALGEDYAERSLRRWLAEMEGAGQVKRQGARRATKYYLVPATMAQSFSPKSLKIIAQIQRPLYERSPVTYNSAWLESYQPNQSFYIPITVRRELYEEGKRSEGQERAGTYAHQIFSRLLIDLSYNSSRLEGNTYSLLDTKKLILEGASAEGKLDEEKIMILNHKEAIRYLVDSTPALPLAKEVIFTLHYLLSDGLVESRYSGKLRDHGVRIGGSTYIPFENPERLQTQLEIILAKAVQIIDPFEQSLFLLIHISYLQAFTDVNKRTARLCANIPLIKANLVPLAFSEIKKDEYISALIAVYELQDPGPLLEIYRYSYRQTCMIYDETIKNMGIDELRVRYRLERRALVREIILKKLVRKKIEPYAQLKVRKEIALKDRGAFLEDLFEDLNNLDQSRISGLGITIEQLNEWKASYKE